MAGAAAKSLLALMVLATAAPAQEADETATFELAVNISWSEQSHPVEFPANAHLSGLLAATHRSRYSMFRDGDTASSGLELVAENGRATILLSELSEAQGRGRVDMVVEGEPIRALPGGTSLTFTAKKSHPLVSFVTMIAPSPDWFTGAYAVSLTKDGAWIEREEFALWAWDSGTDGGETFAAKNLETQPRQSIRLLATPHFLSQSGLIPVGTATVLRVRP